MIVGFTGTQQGCTSKQLVAVREILQRLGVTEAHHGDCVGADMQFDAVCAERGIRRVVHPPDNPKLRSFCAGEVVLPMKPYGARNMDIVRAGVMLIATPAQRYEVQRSGTWSTIRYAQRIAKPVIIVWPDGCVIET